MKLGWNYTHALVNELTGHITGWIVNGMHVVDEPFREPDPEYHWPSGHTQWQVQLGGIRWQCDDVTLHRLSDHAIRR